MKDDENFGNIHRSIRCFTLIANMIILLDEKLVLMKKTEKYAQNSSYSVHNLVNSIFLDEETKTRKNYA